MAEVVVDYFKSIPEGTILDATVGGGGHAQAILKENPRINLIGMDQDPEAIRYARARLESFRERVVIRRHNFKDLAAVLEVEGVEGLSGILFDLGLSWHQVQTPKRGFSYRLDGPLDMRMDPERPRSALGLIRGASRSQLERVLKEYGEEPYYRRIAQAIYERRRKLETTRELAQLIARCVPARKRNKAQARVFQALRIWVNEELAALKAGLEQGLEYLIRGGVAVVLAYHSLEDRIVKGAFRARAGEFELLTKKPLRPGPLELAANPAARSARLRAARRIS
jgi:16S rRNA (cytosine1402-N4)-methyltransferase